MQKIKYICDVQSTHFVVASIVCGSCQGFDDTQRSHFSFAVFGIEPKVFIEALEEMFRHRNGPETYYHPKEITLKTLRAHDTIRMTLDCTTLAITRGNLKVLYCGSIDRLSGLPAALRKS